MVFTKVTDGAIATNLNPSFSAAWADYDKDGFVDLFVGNSFGNRNSLFRNNTDGTFTQVTNTAPANLASDSAGAAWGDLDNDGFPDLFVASWSDPAQDRLFRNDGKGGFTRITTGTIVNDSGPGLGVALVDFDNDGLLDVSVANAMGVSEYLHRNTGNLSFQSLRTGPFVTSGGASHGLAWSDVDGDGDQDVLLGDGDGKNLLFVNAGGGVLAVLRESPLSRRSAPTRGVAFGDVDNDGRPDAVTASGDGALHLYRNRGQAEFVLDLESGLSETPGEFASPSFADVDNDGHLDLVVTSLWGNPNRLYRNLGDGRFSRDQDSLIASEGGRSYGAAWGDYDNDGFMDLFVANASPDPNGIEKSRSFLYHNDGGGAPNPPAWVKFVLVGGVSNRSAIGAKVFVLADVDGTGSPIWQMREISGGDGWAQQSDPRPNFGLGQALKVERVKIHWPSGIIQELPGPAPRTIHTLIEPPLLEIDRNRMIRVRGARDLDHTIEASENLDRWTSVGIVKGGQTWQAPGGDSLHDRFYRASVAP